MHLLCSSSLVFNRVGCWWLCQPKHAALITEQKELLFINKQKFCLTVCLGKKENCTVNTRECHVPRKNKYLTYLNLRLSFLFEFYCCKVRVVLRSLTGPLTAN
jgi:hypothetical protein